MMRTLQEQALVLGKTGILPCQTFKVAQRERSTHMYVVGVTGKGKSKFLESLIFQDATQHNGLCIIDPHGLLVDDSLRFLISYKNSHYMNRYFFEEQLNADKLIYLDPTRTDYILPFNPLAKTDKTDNYTLAYELVEVFKRIWSKSLSEAPNFSDIFINGLLVLIENNLTLIELQRLLTDKPYRDSLLQHVEDRAVINFFKDRFDKWGREAPHMIESTANKASAFIRNPQIRYMVGQKSCLDLRAVMDEGKILMIRLTGMATETTQIIGSLFASKLQQTAFARHTATTPRKLYLYLDEFQLFTATEGGVETFARMLSEARKYGLVLILSHQTQSQMGERMQGALGNTGIKVIFGVDRPDAESMAKRIFLPDVDKIKHLPPTDTQYPYYDALQNQWEKHIQLLDAKVLKDREAIVVCKNSTARKIKTLDVDDKNCTAEQLEMVKRYSLKRWGRPFAEVKKEVDKRLYDDVEDGVEDALTFR